MEHFNLCFLKDDADLKKLSHFEQLNGFSPVWILLCIFKSLDDLHA